MNSKFMFASSRWWIRTCCRHRTPWWAWRNSMDSKINSWTNRWDQQRTELSREFLTNPNFSFLAAPDEPICSACSTTTTTECSTATDNQQQQQPVAASIWQCNESHHINSELHPKRVHERRDCLEWLGGRILLKRMRHLALSRCFRQLGSQSNRRTATAKLPGC